MTRAPRSFWLVLLLVVSLVTPALADSYYAYSQAGIPAGADIFTWCDTPPCDLYEFVNCATPEGGTSLWMNAAQPYGGYGVFLLGELADLSAFESGEMRFFVRTPEDLKVEFQCRPDTANVTYTTFISQHGWDGTNSWQEIAIPIADFFAPDPVDPACLATIFSPFMVTIENLPFLKSFQADFARWETENSHVGASSVQVQGRELLVNGEPFVLNGLSYAPLGIGENWQAAWRDREDRYSVDFPLIADSGANTVRLYAPIMTKAMLDAAWAEGLHVIPTFGVDSIQLECPAGKDFMRDRFVDMVSQWKDHPAILAWLIGNEVNAHLGGANLCSDWYPQLDSMAEAAHLAEDPTYPVGRSFHPIGTATADIAGLADVCDPGCSDDTALPNVDFWGLQLYRGCTFGTAFTQYEAKADCDRPLIVTEFGADAWRSDSHCSVTTGMTCYVNADCPVGECSVTTSQPCHEDAACPSGETCVGGEFCDGAGSADETMQADCLGQLLAEADQALATRTPGPGGVSSGQVLFEWTDEWWKAQCLSTTSWSAQDSCAGYVNLGYTMDPGINEEWWGIASLDDANPDARDFRASYDTVAESWQLGAVCNQRVVSHDPVTGDTTVAFDPGAGSTDHTLYYGPLSALSTYGYTGSVSGLGATGSATVTLPPGELFWLIVARNNREEGCYGYESTGVERPCYLVSGSCDIPPAENRSCQCPAP
jgi:hypothetical protein